MPQDDCAEAAIASSRRRNYPASALLTMRIGGSIRCAMQQFYAMQQFWMTNP